MRYGAKTTPEQRQELLALYLTKGFYTAKPLAESYGISPRHVAKIARRNGHVNNYSKRDYTKGDLSTKAPPKPKRVAKPRTASKPKTLSARKRRWQWAIERGAIAI